MAPSQLAQLKAALGAAGLSRTSKSNKDKKAGKKGGAQDVDRAKKLHKLEEIRRGLNKFDERETKVKHDVGGRNLKGVTGRPSASRQAGLEQRKKSLLPEHQLKDHTGTFQDRRFGESNPSLSIEDRMLERYTRERQRGGGKKGMFNLEDEDEDLDGLDDGFAMGGLTHGGKSVLDLKGDDFEGLGLGEDEEEKGAIDRRTVRKTHFGGFGEDQEEDELPERKKSKQEVMSELISKSKAYKYERQHQNELDADLREEIDGDMDDLRALLRQSAPERSGSNTMPLGGPSKHLGVKSVEAPDIDVEYDQVVKSLAFEARAKPKDRTKTEDELAIEEKEKLEKAEKTRLRRMRGEESEEEEGGRKRRKTEGRKADADDLDDDFDGEVDEEGNALLGPGLTREDIENMAVDESEDEDEDEDDDDEEDDESDEEKDDNESEESAMEDLQEEEVSEGEEAELVSKRSKSKSKSKTSKSKQKEIPFTFTCPSTIENFEDILDDLDDDALPTVVQRIRALHHPSLAAGNKDKLKLDAVSAAAQFTSKLALMQKNLARGLSRGATKPDSKTYPSCPELVLLRLVGAIWSTSDFSHPVVVPSVLLSCQYLGQSRIRTPADLASGLFLCSLLAHYEALSKRIVPEAINFIAASVLALLPRRKGAEATGSTVPELQAGDTNLSLVSPVVAREPANLPALIKLSEDDDQAKADLLAVVLRLIQAYTTLYSSSEAFIEIFQPVLSVLEGSRVAKLSPELKVKRPRVSLHVRADNPDPQKLHADTVASTSRMLGFARTSRQPLALQAHKPIPLATYAPKFEENYSLSKHYDPDVERNSTSKLKALFKKERKGAIRELRKDNKFLAGEKSREQAVKDKAYTTKMRRVEGEIHVERAEEKAMEREKNRDKRRAGRG
ncbi:nucleolar protein 14, partial [Tremellales sp. Uapishka_1]